MAGLADTIHRLSLAWRRRRRAFKDALPYVRRREYRILQRKYAALIDTVGDSRRALDAAVRIVKQPTAPLAGELCLFVTHAGLPVVKAHVAAHIDALIDAGIAVVLIANTDADKDAFSVAPALLARLSAVVVRDNLGFDFAAWAHGLVLCGGPGVTRLYLVNDSLVGPLDRSAFAAMIERVRQSSADVVGLTENPRPLPHLQSFFLVFGARALASAALYRFFQGLLALPTKEQVIDVYETRLTERLRRAGLTTQALFPPMSNDPHSANDVFHHWHALVRAGFPYVKTRVLVDFGSDPRLRALVPAEYFDAGA